MSIALARSVGSFFQDAVGEAVRAHHIEATEEVRSYLVALLSDFARPDPARDGTFERPLTFLLDEALHAPSAQRFQRLRVLGDGVLYIAGFFADHIENRGVDVGYVSNVGATAYRSAATMLRRTATAESLEGGGARGEDENVFGELSRKFNCFVEVLTTVSETTLAQQARGERGVLKLYERWLRSGSETLASELGARGIVPLRGGGGLH
jgi:hypothetical protein